MNYFNGKDIYIDTYIYMKTGGICQSHRVYKYCASLLINYVKQAMRINSDYLYRALWPVKMALDDFSHLFITILPQY